MQFNKNGMHNTKVIPLYSRVESVIRNKILNGQLESGKKLPSEQELAAQFGISKITIRTALSHLCNQCGAKDSDVEADPDLFP